MARITVIDDNQDIVELVATLLESKGHTVTSANDGAQGLKLVEKELPDLVVLDLNLPSLDGHEICERLKAQSPTKKIPIVMLTAAYTSDDDARRGLSLGADAFVVKPFVHKPFLDTITRLLT